MINKEYIKLEGFNDNYPSPVTIEKTEKILKQMRECVCKIYSENPGTGFFTKIENISVLITNYHVLKKGEIKKKGEINYSFGSEKKIRSITYEPNTRKIYYNEDLDYTAIEILNQDNIEEKHFLEIDKNIERNNFIHYPIYLLGYPGEGILNNEIHVSYGIIQKIEKRIIHLSSTDKGSSGSPILSLKNCKVIGYHFGNYSEEKVNVNLGTFIGDFEKKIFNESIEIFKKNNQSLNEIKIIYNISNLNNIKIFGKEFVKNNINKCEIIYEGKQQKLSEYFKINDNIKENGKLEITLKETNVITNMSHLFSGCLSLRKIEDISEFNTKFVTNMSNIFNDCSNLESLPNKLDWDTTQITDMSSMFRNCSSLKKLPDISKWKTYDVTNIKGIFSGCKNLKEIPDISRWYIDKVTNMKRIFSGCSSLTSIPDISRWNTKQVKDMGGMFTGCSELKELPKISNWDTGNVEDMSEMFSICTKLSELPDIYKWNTSKVKNMRGMFSGCQELRSINLIYKWDTKNVIDMSQMFINCINLNKIEDIYKWDVTSVKNTSYMFYGCKELKSLPNISNWKIKENKSKMFEGTGISVPLNLKEDCTIY